MSKATGYILRFSSERQQVFNERHNKEGFAEAVPEFEHSRNVPLVCFVVSQKNAVTHICLGSRGRLAGTDLRRLNMTGFYELRSAIFTDHILQRIPAKNKHKVDERLRIGGLLSPKAFEALIGAVSELSPETATILARYREERRERIANLPSTVQHALAEQKEALLTAMAIAGIDRDEVSGWDFSEETGPVSFLAGLPSVRLREDQMIINDLSILPGHKEIASTIHSSTVFKNSTSRLTVVLANRLPLEEQTGADLIYYNETFKCFLMVQYKAMEKEGDEFVFRFPNNQLTEEIKRMDCVLSALSLVADDRQADGYRLSENPFFLKICPRIVFNPDNVGLSTGMYLPLDYWRRISEHPGLIGPRGGKRLSYRNVRRYFDNSEFVSFASGGWVGSNAQQSSLLSTAIRETVHSGRVAVIAINQELDDRHRFQPDDSRQL
ncbi:hypothetical protein [Sphaerotilus montanus]|uniref:hypothetical protein n=1 Tax=Sphaerotilus montanus TaxID=522889 RepID=UPI003FA26451